MTEEEYIEGLSRALAADFEQQHGHAPGPDEQDAITGGIE